ncbi:MAG: hypothetical protein QM289_04315 [Bacillota bacterium]|jgi:hypothetical protein|nr:hypothetical protein [Bacillota bacterium]NLM08460.1 hypothetical protein [Clostridiales Family XIII bacterium]
MSEKTIFDRLEDYIKANYVGEAIDFVCDEVTDHTQDDPDDPFTAISESVSCRPVVDSDQIPLDEVTESFQETFLNFLGIKADSELYDKIPIDRKLISKIRDNADFIPNKNLVILLGIGLELNREEMDALLRSARYRLSRSHKDELAIAFCIENKIYDVKQIDQLFDDQGLLPISQRI